MLPYHPGEREVQARTGEFDEALRHAGVIRSTIPPPVARFLATLPWLVVGAADPSGSVWATALFGMPGFIEASGDEQVRVGTRLQVDDPLAGSATPGPIEAGLLAIDPARRFRARINGLLAAGGDGRGPLTVQVRQVYPNCMKYIQRRELTLDPDRLGRRPEARRADRLHDDDLVLLAAADTFFVATRAPGQGADVSHRGGRPGFLVADHPRRLSFPDYRGNSMFNTFGNLDLDPRCGLLVPDFASADLLHVSGRAEVDYEPGESAAPGALRMVHLTVDRVVRRRTAFPLRAGPVEYSPFLPDEPAGR